MVDAVAPSLAASLNRTRLAPVADGLAVAVAVSLPWSTSATSILIVLWLIAVVPTLDVASVRREAMTPAGGLPVLLWALGALGMLWADASWSDRLHGLGSFHKLLVIPLLLAQFRRSERGHWVVIGFLGSALVLLVVSWGLALIPGLTWRGNNSTGVPVKDYILQSGIFALCAFGLLAQAVELWRARRLRLALVLALVAALFIANIFYVVTGRTTIVVMVALLLMFGLWFFGWKGVLAAGLIGAVLASLMWVSSPYLRDRVTRIAADIQEYRTNLNTPVGLRLEFWRKSIDFVARAPLIGHGTGSIKGLFRADATVETDPAAIATNPHNQILTVALQLGLAGIFVLIAMWIAHLALFRGGSLMSWFGMMIVAQNIVSSLFNSHLFDFTQGWLYVFGVGIIGGSVLGRAQGADTIGAKA
jgi:O-antigen ligase